MEVGKGARAGIHHREKRYDKGRVNYGEYPFYCPDEVGVYLGPQKREILFRKNIELGGFGVAVVPTTFPGPNQSSLFS